MSLIEQLGGYEKAKKYHEDRVKSHKTFIADNLEKQLLEYRREHGIFEVGDWVVDEALSNSVIQYHDDYNYMPKWVLSFVRHATIKEIEAGRRLCKPSLKYSSRDIDWPCY